LDVAAIADIYENPSSWEANSLAGAARVPRLWAQSSIRNNLLMVVVSFLKEIPA
jgi:hypothetical protein